MAETFAFAISLWQWINKREISWAKFLHILYNSSLSISSKNIETLHTYVNSFVEKERSKLKQQDPNSIYVQVNTILINMIEPIPSKRLNLKDALSQFNKLSECLNM